jgi:carbonic anhydrase
MDARIDPAKALGLEEGDAHVIRNGEARVRRVRCCFTRGVCR